MSDPFERFRGPTEPIEPDVDAIRSRARGIQRRRQVVLGAGAVAVVLIAGIGLAVRNGPDTASRQLAQASPTASVAPEPEAAASSGDAVAQRSAVVAASPQAKRKTAADTTGEGSSFAAAGRADSTGLRLMLDVKRASARSVALTLKACNDGSSTITRSFPSGQRYDFEVRRGGSVVWRWSDGRVFTQETGQETWKPGACKTWTEAWDGTTSSGAPASPGSYEAVGILKSSPEQRSAPKSFCLDVC